MLKKKALAYFLTSTLLLPSFSGVANTVQSSLPDIGTTAAGTLTIDKELEYGDAYMRMLRASRPIINDPLLNEYVSSLGHRLVANASDVKTPFHFFLIRNKEINAFAFFGGYVALHTGLFLYAQDESELASVVAHEIAHITQRHLARAMEDQARKSPLTIAALIGSLMLAVAAPEAGIAAAQATTAASIQSRINYTRSNEQEADRIGIDTLARAGFNPKAMPAFFGRMLEQYRYASKPPEFLLTHPLPESRITESRARAQQYPSVMLPPSEPYHLARARIIARFSGLEPAAALDWFTRQEKKASLSVKPTLEYGKALVYLDTRKPEKAAAILDKLIRAEPENRFFLDAMTDLYVQKKEYAKASEMLEKALRNQPENRVLELNRYYVMMEAGKYQDAISFLNRYTHNFPSDISAWSMLQEAYDRSGKRPEALAAQGELFALAAQWPKAINNYIQASQLAPIGSLDQARYDARIDQLRVMQQRFESLQ